MSEDRGPTEVGYFSSPRGTSYTMNIEGHYIEIYLTPKRKQVRVFVDGYEWKKPNNGR